jgi:hypothetical protein
MNDSFSRIVSFIVKHDNTLPFFFLCVRDQQMSMLILIVFNNNIFNSQKKERYQITTEKIKIKREREV